MSSVEGSIAEVNAEPGLQAQQSKEDFMVACLADGTARETCENRWNAAHEVSPEVEPQNPPPTDAAALLRENEMLRSRVKVRERQLKQAIKIANRANDEAKARRNAEKEMLMTSIQMDSHFKKEELSNKSLFDLQTIRITLDKSMEQKFASVAAADAEARKRRPKLSAGYWNGTKWVGGA